MSGFNNNLNSGDNKPNRPKSYLWDEFKRLQNKNKAEDSTRKSEPDNPQYQNPGVNWVKGGRVDCEGKKSADFLDINPMILPTRSTQPPPGLLTPNYAGIDDKRSTVNTDKPVSPPSQNIQLHDSSSDSEVTETVKFEVKDKKVGTKILVEIEEVDEKVTINYDKVIFTPILKITFEHNGRTWECIAEVAESGGGVSTRGCEKTLTEVAKVTDRHPSKSELQVRIDEEVTHHFKIRTEPVVDYVLKNYPLEFQKLESDPFGWILEKTSYILGYERLKILTFLSIVSSRMDRVTGMSRLHILLVGKSGAGKSSTVKSVINFLEGTGLVIKSTRFTPNALGYLDIDKFDGRVVFLEQIDNQNINYLREMMTEDKICTYVPMKVKDEYGERIVTQEICKYGQASVISTSVIEGIDVNKEQLFNRWLKVYVKPDVNIEEIGRAILTRKKIEISIKDKLVFLAYLLTRPTFANTEGIVDKALEILRPLVGVTSESLSRAYEMLRNLLISVAIAHGRTQVTMDDVEFVVANFKWDILYNGLGLTERDIEIIKVLDESESLKTSEVAMRLKLSKQYALNLLKDLERKGVVESEMPEGKVYVWRLSELGETIKSLLEELDTGVPKSNEKLKVSFSRGVAEVRNEKGEVVGLLDSKFRTRSDGGGDNRHALSAYDGRGMPGDEAETDQDAEEGEDVPEEFKEYVKKNDNVIKFIRDIKAEFQDNEKAKKFLSWCLSTGHCEPYKEFKNQTIFDRVIIHANP